MNQRDIHEKKLFDQFYDQKSPVSDDMWESISVQLDAQKKKRRRPIFFWWFFVMLLGSVITFQFLKNSNGISIKENSSIPVNQSQTLSQTSIIQQTEEKKISGSVSSELAQMSTNRNEIESFNNTSVKEGRLHKTEDVKISEKEISTNNLTNYPTNNSPNNSTNNSNLIPLIDNSLPSYSKLPESEDADSGHPMDILDHPVFTTNSLTSSPSLIFLNAPTINVEATNISGVYLDINKPIVHKKKIRNFVEINAGIGKPFKHMSSSNLENSALNFRKETEKPLYSWNSNILIGFDFMQTWTIAAGLEWSEIIEKFNYTNGKATRIEVKIDPSTQQPSDTSLVRGTLSERGQNTLSLLNIPLNIGYQKKLGSWKVGLEAGLGLNVRLKSSGKILLAEQDVKSLADLNYIYKTKIGLSSGLAISFERHLSKHVSFMIKPQYITYFSDWSQNSNPVSVYYDMLSLNVGIKHYF